MTRRGTDGGFPNEGLTVHIVSKFWFGLKIIPRMSLGVKMGGIDAENHEESENRSTNSRHPENNRYSLNQKQNASPLLRGG